MAIKQGDKCPSFTLPNQKGEEVNIDDLVGKSNLVIFFYPKDESPGCTKQVCSFRDNYNDFLELGAEVIGISSNTEDQHKGFVENHNLPFTLLADTQKKVRKLFGVPSDLMGLIPGRVTYIIDKKGIVKGIFNSQLKFENHTSEAIKVLKNIGEN